MLKDARARMTVPAAAMTLGNFITAIFALVGAAVGSWVTYALTRRTTVWDLRRQAYGAIWSELEAAERVVDLADEYIQESTMAYFGSGHEAKHNAQIAEHMAAVRKRFANDRLVLSDAFVALYEQLNRDLNAGDSYNDTPPEEHDVFAKAIRKNRPLLLAQARAEVAGRRGSRFFRRSIPSSGR